MSEILTIDELAAILKMTRSQVYSLTRARAKARLKNPLPKLSINGNIRFRRSDIEKWLEKVATEEAA